MFLATEVSLEEHIRNEVNDLDVSMLNKEETELSCLRKALHHYKAQNSHLNHLNDQLVSPNHMIRQDLEDINANYVELVQATEEEVKRRKISQEVNAKLLEQNQELQEKVHAIKEELTNF